MTRRQFFAITGPGAVATATTAPAVGISADRDVRGERPGLLRAGAATANITPDKGVSLDGTIMRIGPAKAVHDNLYARALVLDDGVAPIAIVICDATFMGAAVHDEAKEIVRERTGVPPDRILTATTHSHMAVRMLPSIAARHPENAKYHKNVSRRIAEAVCRAMANRAPARVGWGVAAKPQYCRNRRWVMKPGTLGPNPFGEYTDRVQMGGQPEKNRVRPAGPVDPDLSVLSIEYADGRPLALLANYSVHYAGMVRGHVSADYFGFFAARMEERLGRDDDRPPFVAIMSNGTSGDIDRAPGGDFEGMRRVGHSVADTAIQVYRTIQHRDRVALAMLGSEIELGVRRPDKERLAWARQVQAGTWNEPAHRWRDVYAHNALMLAAYPPRVSLKLQAIRIGELGIAACPCETFAETGLAIKAGSPLKPTFTIELANGFGGYLPPPAQHELGGYTTWPAESSYLEIQAEPKIRAEILRLLRSV